MNHLALFGQYYQPESYDGYYYESNYTADDSTAIFATLFFIFFFLFITVIAYAVHAFFLGRIFKKAGVQQWKAWVPIYNQWVFLELGGQQGFWAVLLLVPVVNIVSVVFIYIASYYIGRNLGKDDAFVLLAIFLPIVWLIWLAIDSSTWKSKKPATKTS